jgi:hypothetical protein
MLLPPHHNLQPPTSFLGTISTLCSLAAIVNIHDILDGLKRKVINKDGSGTVQDQNQGVKIKRTFALSRKGGHGD